MVEAQTVKGKRGPKPTGKALVAITLRVPADVAEELKRRGPGRARDLVTWAARKDAYEVYADMIRNPSRPRAMEGDE